MEGNFDCFGTKWHSCGRKTFQVIRTLRIPSEKQLRRLPRRLQRIENNTVSCIVSFRDSLLLSYESFSFLSVFKRLNDFSHTLFSARYMTVVCILPALHVGQ